MFASGGGGQIMALRLVDGALLATTVADAGAMAVGSFAEFVCRSMTRGDIDGDGRAELVLGGRSGRTATVFVCHEDGSEARFSSLGEPGWVSGMAVENDGPTLIFAIETSVISRASPVFLQDGELVVSWEAGDLPGGPLGPDRWPRSALVSCELGPAASAQQPAVISRVPGLS